MSHPAASSRKSENEKPTALEVLKEHSVRIGDLEVFPPLLLAPMAGLTHAPFRRFLAEFGGVGLYYSEMLSARALRHEGPAERRLLDRGSDAEPLCLQVFASEPDQIAPAVERGGLWQPAAWDLNFGCPAPEIVKQGAGAAFMKSPQRARAMAAAMRSAVRGPLLFKTRVQEEPHATLSFVRMLEEEGADAVILHARKAGEKYGRPARWERLRGLQEKVSIPLVGNGDVRKPGDVAGMMEHTGCRAVMIGRRAVEEPWLFRRAARLFGAPLPPLRYRRKSEAYQRLATLIGEAFDRPRDLYRLREFTAYYCRTFKFGHQLWKRVNRSRSMDEAAAEAARFFERNGDEDVIEE